MPPKTGGKGGGRAGVGRQRQAPSRKTPPKPPTESQKNAISTLFKRIESSDSFMLKCGQCGATVKSCLMKDHLESKCDTTSKKLNETQINEKLLDIREQRRKKSNEETIIVLDSSIDEEDKGVKDGGGVCGGGGDEMEAKKVRVEVSDVDGENSKEISAVGDEKASKLGECGVNGEDDEDDKLLNEYLSTSNNDDENKEKSGVIKSLEFDIYLNNFTQAIESVLDQETFSCLLNEADYDVIKRFSILTG